MAGASEATVRVHYVNGNWTPGDGGHGSRGTFELHLVTEDGERHSVPVHGDDAGAVIALTQASGVMLFDPASRTLIAANLAGEWFQQDWSAGRSRREGRPHGEEGPPDPSS